jgi:hypothetical protein
MDAEVKQKWVSALRSGEYPQTKRSLRNDEGFCCLGVLCDVMGGRWKTDGEVVVNGRTQAGYLDDGILSVIGISEKQQLDLYWRNDEGESFARIADHIEASL